MMEQEKIFRFAIMGAGGIAEKFCDAVNQISNMEVVAVASKSLDRAEQFAKKNHVAQAYDSYEQMLKEADPDGVYIATTPNYHFELTMLCLDYKKPVLCEKAMLVNAEEAGKVFKRSKELGVFVMEGMWSRFLPHNIIAKKWLEEGKIGNVELAEINIGFPAGNDPKNRFNNPELAGGAATDVTVYCFELMTYFLDRPIRDMHTYMIRSETGVDKTEQISILYDNCIANMHASIAARLNDDAVFYGTEGKIVIPLVHYGQECILYRDQEEPVHFQDQTENGFVFEIQEMVDCVRRGEVQSKTAPHEMTIRCAEMFDQLMGRKE